MKEIEGKGLQDVAGYTQDIDNVDRELISIRATLRAINAGDKKLWAALQAVTEFDFDHGDIWEKFRKKDLPVVNYEQEVHQEIEPVMDELYDVTDNA